MINGTTNSKPAEFDKMIQGEQSTTFTTIRAKLRTQVLLELDGYLQRNIVVSGDWLHAF